MGSVRCCAHLVLLLSLPLERFAIGDDTDNIDKEWVDCWGRGGFARDDCCKAAHNSLSCWDSIYTRKECCSLGRARLFPTAESVIPAWERASDWVSLGSSKEQAVRRAFEIRAESQLSQSMEQSLSRTFEYVSYSGHPAFSDEQIRWETEALNSSVMLSTELFGHRIRIWVFKRSGPAMAEVLDELREDHYRLQMVGSMRRGSMAVDVGASIGVVSILMSKIWPSVRVLALEPAPANYRYLLWNLKVNDVAHRIWPFNVALGTTSTASQVFYYSPTYPTWSQTCGDSCKKEAENDSWRGTYADWQIRFEVEVVTLAELLAALRVTDVHFLKVDCEGCEWTVLAPPSWSRLRHLIHNVAAELHRWALYEDPGKMVNAIEASVRNSICAHERMDTGNEQNSVCSTT